MTRDITVGVDGTSAGLAAAHWAALEARRRGSGLTMVHVWHRHPRPAPDVPFGRTERDWAEEILREAAHGLRAAHPDLRVTERLVCDATVTALVAADCDMLVLGSLGLGPVAGFVTGSVSQRVVARCTRPVVLVRAGRGAAEDHLPAVDGVAPEEIPRTPYREVVLGLDTGHPCDELIDFALDAARRRDTGLHVVHAFRTSARPVSDASLLVAPPGSVNPVPAPRVAAAAQAQADAEREVSAVLRAWRDKYPTVPVTESVIEGRAAVALVHAAHDAALLVVGRRGTGQRIGAHAGPVVHAVLHHAGCPVAVVPHG
ncbi:nucleotide-binding universal stress UspA family protein [Streptomyces sp. SAI-135]|uniref:universal stress protein n=1 Tax=unclassified Streptomyces TaxID=2593676 RepID=UPI0024763637|nr:MULTISPECIES: universal stress protein [unclassified Streptomyces]MDH6514140.1 nucleotide-binding universal stress UspA family protein [Streptomyces sp. SAI-090]MDH6621780.1 nucleotide-binding universal stress UspA family protein [Streptomyces sp. SAI-135]